MFGRLSAAHRHARLDHIDVVGKAGDGMQVGTDARSGIATLDSKNSRIGFFQFDNLDLFQRLMTPALISRRNIPCRQSQPS